MTVRIEIIIVMLIFYLSDNKEMVAWLLDNYPDLANIANKNGNHAVHFAAAQGKTLCLSIAIFKCLYM